MKLKIGMLVTCSINKYSKPELQGSADLFFGTIIDQDKDKIRIFWFNWEYNGTKISKYSIKDINDLYKDLKFYQ